jgi:OOP family OmpA-OmpF porin
MEFNFKRLAVLLVWVLTGVAAHAQNPDSLRKSSENYVEPFSDGSLRTWSIGIHGGLLTTFTVLGTNNNLDFTSPGQELGYGGYIKKQFTPAFGIQADFLAGKLTGQDSHPQIGSSISEFKRFSTEVAWSGSLSANLTLGNISWRNHKSAIQPYLTVGAGYMKYTPVVTYSDGTIVNFKAGSDPALMGVFVPIGVGLKFDIARGVNIDLGYQVNFLFADNLDGFNYGGNNDKFSYAHIGLEFAIGSSSKPQLAAHNPVSSMRTEYLGQIDLVKKQLQAQIDSQKVAFAAEKAKNIQLEKLMNTLAENNNKYSKDSDGDGVPDAFDKCPGTPPGTKVDGSGCPLPKADVKVYVTDDDKKIVKEAIQNLEFDLGKAEIRQQSFESLNKVAQLLIDKNFSLKLAGHTDNIGTESGNMKLSKDRAEAVRAYLVSKGVNASRIEATGYGSTQPIAPNTTAIGRQFNRRVEFTLF